MKRVIIQMLAVGVVLAFSLALCLAEEPEKKKNRNSPRLTARRR